MSTNVSQKRDFITDFKRFTPLLKNLVSKDIKIKYRRSVLGIAWSILNPLLTMIVMTLVFSYMLRVNVGTDFATYYIVGSSLWAFFSEGTSLAMTSILGASSLIKKVYIPKYIFPLEKTLFSLVNFLFTMVAVFLVIFIRGVTPGWTWLFAPLPIIYCAVFVCGMSLLLSAATVFFRDIIHLYGVILTMWMYLTPIFYDLSLIKGDKPINRFIISVIKCNPLYRYIDYFRNVLIYKHLPGLKENAICIGISLVALFIGWLVFKKSQHKFILHI